MTTLDLTDAQVSVIAHALFREREHVYKGRAIAEKQLADPGILARLDWVGAARRDELALAAIDDLVDKLPPWVAVFFADMRVAA